MSQATTRTVRFILLAFAAMVAGCGNKALAPVAPLPSPPLNISRSRPQIVEIREAVPPAAPVEPARPVRWPCEGRRPWKYIVIHHSATDSGNAEVFDRAHRARGWDGLGYHFVVTNGRGGADGKVEVSRRWKTQKWGAHTGGTPNNEYNNFGIGICLVGDFIEKMPSERQLASLAELLAELTERFDIAPENIIGHCDAPDSETLCPGEALHEYLHRTVRPRLLAAANRKSSSEPTSK